MNPQCESGRIFIRHREMWKNTLTGRTRRFTETGLPSWKVAMMSIGPDIDQNTIRSTCEVIRRRWDAKTAAKRRLIATALQRELAQRLDIGFEPADNLTSTLSPSMVGAA
jgi:hypothetical protein